MTRMMANVTAKKATAVINAKVRALRIATVMDASKFAAAKTEANVITYQANVIALQGLLVHCEC